MKPDVLSKPLKDQQMETIYARLTEACGTSWGVTFADLDESFGCGITISGYTRMGMGDTVHAALLESAKLWGIGVQVAPDAPPPPLPPPPPPPSETPGKIWTDERTKKMRDIKAKLHITGNEQFGVHLEAWSDGKARTIKDLTDENVDSFIKHMYDKYVNRINEGGLDDIGVSSQPDANGEGLSERDPFNE